MKKLGRTCGMFLKIRHFLPVNVLIFLYSSLIASFLKYSIVVWGSAYVVHIQPIFLLQKRIMRAIAFQPFTSPIFSDLKILKLQELRQLKRLSFVYEYVNKIASVCFILSLNQSNLFINMILKVLLSKNDIFLTQKDTLQYGIRSIRFTSAKFWNSIPSNSKQSVSLVYFYYKLKSYLLTKSIEN